MIHISWVEGIDGHIEALVQTSTIAVSLCTPEEVSDFVSSNIDLLDDSHLAFLGQGFAVLCFRVHMRSVRDPVHMKDQMRRLMDACYPCLNILGKDQAFDRGVARILDTIRSNLRSDFLALLEIMTGNLSVESKG